MPEGVEDRVADVWESLIAIADAAGERWSKNGRDAAVSFVEGCKETEPSFGVRLLSDLRLIFSNDTQLATRTILQRLCDLEEAPWGDLRGKPLDARRLAKYLGEYGVKSTTIRTDINSTPKGYRVEELLDAWIRYLPTPEISATAATAQQVNDNAGFSVADKSDVADTSATSVRQTPHSNPDSVRDVADVAAVAAVGEGPNATEKLTI